MDVLFLTVEGTDPNRNQTSVSQVYGKRYREPPLFKDLKVFCKNTLLQFYTYLHLHSVKQHKVYSILKRTLFKKIHCFLFLLFFFFLQK